MHEEQREALIAEAEKVADDADKTHFIASLEYLTARHKVKIARDASTRAQRLVMALKAALPKEEAQTLSAEKASEVFCPEAMTECEWCPEKVLFSERLQRYIHVSGPQTGFEACERDMQSCRAWPKGKTPTNEGGAT